MNGLGVEHPINTSKILNHKSRLKACDQSWEKMTCHNVWYWMAAISVKKGDTASSKLKII